MTPLQNKPTKPASARKRPMSSADRAARELQSRTKTEKTAVKKSVSVNPAPAKRTERRTPPPRRLRKKPRTLPERILGYAKEKIASLPYLLPEGDFVARVLICTGLILFFALLQTTVFARFRPLGVIPDLMLPLVIAISMAEGEKWGASVGIAAAFVIESLGTTGITLLPLLYMAAGYFAPIVTSLYFTDSVPVRVMYTAVSGVGRAVMTLLYLSLTVSEFHLLRLCGSIVLPEYAATCLTAILPHLAVRLCLRPFHKSRAERTETL